MDYASHYESHWYIFSSFGRNTWNYDDVTDCCLGLMTKNKKSLIKNVINFAISLFFSLLQQKYNNNTMSMKEIVSHRNLFDGFSV